VVVLRGKKRGGSGKVNSLLGAEVEVGSLLFKRSEWGIPAITKGGEGLSRGTDEGEAA